MNYSKILHCFFTKIEVWLLVSYFVNVLSVNYSGVISTYNMMLLNYKYFPKLKIDCFCSKVSWLNLCSKWYPPWVKLYNDHQIMIWCVELIDDLPLWNTPHIFNYHIFYLLVLSTIIKAFKFVYYLNVYFYYKVSIPSKIWSQKTFQALYCSGIYNSFVLFIEIKPDQTT